MEYLLGGIFFVVVPLIIIVAVCYLAVRWFRQNEARKHHEATGEVVESLRYHVPRGQDPAAVLAALQIEGYEAVYDDESNTPDVLILTPAGADRERAHVRSVLAHGTAQNLEGDPQPAGRQVRFADE
jgi:hypothetical protein